MNSLSGPPAFLPTGPAQHSGGASQLTATIDVTFTDTSSLGLRFASLNADSPAIIKAVKPGTQAVNHPRLVPGLVLLEVSGEPAGAYREAIAMIKAADRPLTMKFSVANHGGSGDASRIVKHVEQEMDQLKLQQAHEQLRIVSQLVALSNEALESELQVAAARLSGHKDLRREAAQLARLNETMELEIQELQLEWSQERVEAEKTLKLANDQVCLVRTLADQRVAAVDAAAQAAVGAAEERAAARVGCAKQQIDQLNRQVWEEEASRRKVERALERAAQDHGKTKDSLRATLALKVALVTVYGNN